MAHSILRTADAELEVPDTLPVIPLRDLVFFPYVSLPLLIGRRGSLSALEQAQAGHGLILLVAQKDARTEDPAAEDLGSVGTIARVDQAAALPDGTTRVVFEGLGRARILEMTFVGDRIECSAELLRGSEMADRHDESGRVDSGRVDDLAHGVLRLFEEYVHLNDRLPDDLAGSIAKIPDRMHRAHLISGHLLVGTTEKQELLDARNDEATYSVLREILIRELEILRIEERLDAQIRVQMDRDRRQHYLQEQLKAIQKELGSDEDEWSEIERKIHSGLLPAHAVERADRELGRLRRLNPVSPEAGVIRTYLDWIVDLPWTRTTEDNLDVGHAREILEEAHFGLDEVKDRILDHIAVLSLVHDLQGPILCLAGPPGVGKTSLGRSIATALGREFVRISLGGVRDEAEIRGHRRTYVGALPGRILQGMRKSGSSNPVFLLDEVDKLASDFHGDPSAALLEVLDPEQNRTFEDHYLELEFDLSGVLFVATANTLAGIPGPLRDRMEIIRIPGYLETEKRTIAERFLWPKQIERHGLSETPLSLEPEALEAIIRRYTREAGVRELERQISRVTRKVARRVADGKIEQGAAVEVQSNQLRELLGPVPYPPTDRDADLRRRGIANGLAWTSVGGEILDVEVAAVPGSGEVRLTGTLGDVMRESAFAALTYARSRAATLGLDRQFHRDLDIHIHLPEGATPKDGPSAGITIAIALISALTEVPTRRDVAMTGEITLRGRVLPVGGIKEKTVAALRGGMSTVLLPAANRGDVEDLPKEVLDGLEFILVTTMDDVLDHALAQRVGSADEPPAPDLYDRGESNPGLHWSQ